MRKIDDEILNISHNHYKYLMSLQNVNGLGLGYKYINGVNTLEPCLHVLVTKKLNSKFIVTNNIVPKTYMGIKTDIVEVGKIKFSSNKIAPIKLRPLQGGCDIATIDDEENVYGTLGCIVFKEKNNSKEFYILSNNHVLANSNEAPLGTPIIQPSKTDFDSEEIINNNIVAKLTTYNRLVTFNIKDPKANLVDCAIAKIINPLLISNTMFNIGPIKGIVNPFLDMPIKKIGAATGLTIGKVKTIGSTIKIGDEEDLYYFLDQMVLDLDSSEGDSGSLILNDDNEAIGLLFGSVDEEESEISKITYANKISKVLEILNVKLYTGS